MPWDEALVDQAGKKKGPEGEGGRVITYIEALNEALLLAMEMDPSVFLLGQGVDDPGAMFGVTRDLQKKFGRERVFDTPLSEDAMTGTCVGAAMSGMRPVYFHNRPDFLLLTFNQLVNHASKIHFMDNGLSKVPMVVWSAIGRGWGSGAQHSQSLQGLFLSVPGLRIVMPSTPADAKGLMLSSIADNNPVLIFEHRWLMKRKGAVPEGYYTIPFGKGVYRRTGTDLTVVGTSHAIDLAIEAIDSLKDQGISADVIDLRTLKPMDESIILESLKKTGKLLVVDTGWSMGGACAEIIAVAVEKGFSSLKSPPVRIGLPDVPTPAGYTLEQFYYPTSGKIAEAARTLILRKG